MIEVDQDDRVEVDPGEHHDHLLAHRSQLHSDLTLGGYRSAEVSHIQPDRQDCSASHNQRSGLHESERSPTPPAHSKKEKRDSYLPWATGLRFPLAATSSRMKNQSFVIQSWNIASRKTTKSVDDALSHLVVVLLLVGVSKHGDGDVFVLGDRPDAHPDVRTFHRWLPLHRITHHTSAIVA